MPIYMPFGGIDGDVAARLDATSVRQIPGDGSVKPYPGATEMADRIRKLPTNQVRGILIGLMPVPGYTSVRTENGIIAVLIGLLLPAVQRLAANSADLQVLKAAVGQTGAVGIAMCDGSVRLLAGPPSFRFWGMGSEVEFKAASLIGEVQEGTGI